MGAAYDNGDTSLAFSIAMKVFYAVQTLHEDLDMAQDAPKLQGQSINC